MQLNKDVHLTHDSMFFPPRIGTKGPQFMTVRMKESKTDPFRLGHTITVGATNSEICPVQALENYISLRPPPPSHSWSTIYPCLRKTLTKQVLTTEACKLLALFGFNASNYAGHSYRIGAAPTAAEANFTLVAY